MRSASIERITRETQIRGSLKIEGKGKYTVSTQVRFLDHMLELFTKHGGFDLTISADGDMDVDQHHTVEDIGITFGQAFKAAVGDKKGIVRYGYAYVPLDEALSRVVIDISGRPVLVFKVDFPRDKVCGDGLIPDAHAALARPRLVHRRHAPREVEFLGALVNAVKAALRDVRDRALVHFCAVEAIRLRACTPESFQH